MQAYSRGFARVYNLRWGEFSRRVAPALLALHASAPDILRQAPILDLCCGAGHLARLFLERGCRVVGIDLSEAMLEWAKVNAGAYLAVGQAQFIRADAARFALAESVGLAVSTYDALNHLPDFAALVACLRCVYAALLPAGAFVFDLNTRAGLRRWGAIHVEEDDEVMLVSRGVYDGQGQRAYVQISGFARVEGGLYERFQETAYNSIFDLDAVKTALLDAGFRGVHFARLDDLTAPIAEPEAEKRVFIVGRK